MNTDCRGYSVRSFDKYAAPDDRLSTFIAAALGNVV